MTEEKEIGILKIILFMALMLLIAEMLPVFKTIASPQLYLEYGVLLFFASYILMYFLVERFVKWEGTSVDKLGVAVDKDTQSHLMIGLIAGVAATALIVGFAFFLGGQLRLLDESFASLVLTEIIVTIPIALVEELAHRGYLLPRLEGIAGRNRAILISSIFFSVIHFSWWLTPGIPLIPLLFFIFNMFLGGVVLSLSYYWSGRKLWVPIGFHFAWNMVGYLSFPNYPRDSVILPEIFQFEWGITTVIAFLFGLSIIYGLLLETKRRKK